MPQIWHHIALAVPERCLVMFLVTGKDDSCSQAEPGLPGQEPCCCCRDRLHLSHTAERAANHQRADQTAGLSPDHFRKPPSFPRPLWCSPSRYVHVLDD